jgi:hypothetical protein
MRGEKWGFPPLFDLIWSAREDRFWIDSFERRYFRVNRVGYTYNAEENKFRRLEPECFDLGTGYAPFSLYSSRIRGFRKRKSIHTPESMNIPKHMPEVLEREFPPSYIHIQNLLQPARFPIQRANLIRFSACWKIWEWNGLTLNPLVFTPRCFTAIFLRLHLWRNLLRKRQKSRRVVHVKTKYIFFSTLACMSHSSQNRTGYLTETDRFLRLRVR